MAGLRPIGSTLADIPFNAYGIDGMPSRGNVNVGDFPAGNVTEWTLGPTLAQGGELMSTATIPVALAIDLSDTTTNDLSRTDITGNATIYRLIFRNVGGSNRLPTSENPNLTVGQSTIIVDSVEYPIVGSRDLGTGATLYYTTTPIGSGNPLQNMPVFATTVVGTALTSIASNWDYTLLTNSGVGNQRFNFTLLGNTTGDTVDYRIHVLRDFNLELNQLAGSTTTTGSIGINADGAHLCIVDSSIHFNGVLGATSGRQLFNEINTDTSFETGPSTSLFRPQPFDGTISTRRSINFYSSDVIISNVVGTGTARRLNFTASDVRDTAIRFLDPDGSGQTTVACYPKPLAVWNNVSMQDIRNRTDGTATLFVSGATTFIDCDVRGFAFQMVDIARAKTFGLVQSPGLLAGFNAGFVDTQAEVNNIPYGNLGYLKAVNPTITIDVTETTPGSGVFTNLGQISYSASNNALGTDFRTAQRYVELQQWLPAFTEGVDSNGNNIPANLVNVFVRYSHSFAEDDNYTTLSETDALAAYSTNANGAISTGYVPDVGNTTTFPDSDGLQVPVANFGATTPSATSSAGSTLMEDMSAEFDIRSFYHIANEQFTINRQTLLNRAADASTNGTTITAANVFQIDGNIRRATLFSNPTADPEDRIKQPIATINTGLLAEFTDDSAATPQAIYEYLKSLWATPSDMGYQTNLNQPTVTGAAVNWQGSLRLGTTTAYDNGGNQLTIQGNAFTGGLGDAVQGLNIDGTLGLNNRSCNVNIDVHTQDQSLTLTIDDPRTFPDARTTTPDDVTFGGTVQRSATTINVPAGQTQYVRVSQISEHRLIIANSGPGTLIVSGPAQGDLRRTQTTDPNDGTISSGGITIATTNPNGTIEFEPAPAFTHTINLQGFSPDTTSGFQVKLYQGLTGTTLLPGTSRQQTFDNIVLNDVTTPGLNTGFNFTIGIAAHGIPVQFIPVAVGADGGSTTVTFDSELIAVNTARDSSAGDMGNFTRSFNVAQTVTGDTDNDNTAAPTITLTGFDADVFTSEALNIRRLTALREFEDFMDALRTRAGTLTVAGGRVNGDIMRAESNQELFLHPDVRIIKGTNSGQQHLRGVLRGMLNSDGVIVRLTTTSATANNILLLRTREVSDTRDVFNPGERTINIIQGELTQADLDAARNAIIGNIYGAS